MYYRHLLILLMAFTVIWTSCKKDKLTKETQEGLNTYSCKVNGDVFLPKKQSVYTGPALNASLSTFSGKLSAQVFAINTVDEPRRKIIIVIEEFKGVGTYL